MSGNRWGYRPGAPIPYRPDQPSEKRYGFHPAQYHKAQANDVYLQYQRQVARDKTEKLKKRSERNLDGKLKINNLELVFLTINARRWFGISQIVSVLFSHRPRSSVVTRMKMLGIEFYCGNYDELRRMKELGGVETHCSRCKLISEQDLVKLLLCFYRFTALPRGKGKISTNGLSTYLDDILREIAMGRVELGKDFHEDDTGKIDDETWSQISERMLLKNAEKVEHITRGPAPTKKDTFAFEDESEIAMPLEPYAPRSQRGILEGKQQQQAFKSEPQDLSPDVTPIGSPSISPEPASAAESPKDEAKDQKEMDKETAWKSAVRREGPEQESMALLLPKLIRAERTKKPPRAIWPRWYPPAEGEVKDDGRPTIMLKHSDNFPLSPVSVRALQCLFKHFRKEAKRSNKIQEERQYMIDEKRTIDPAEVKEVKIKRDTGEECIISLEDFSLKDLQFGEDDLIQIVTRQDLEDQFNKAKQDSCSCKSAEERAGDDKDGTRSEEDKCNKEPTPPKPEPVEYTPEQLEYVQKLKDSFDFPYNFSGSKLALDISESDAYDETDLFLRPRAVYFKRNPVADNQIFRKLMLQKRPTIVTRKGTSNEPNNTTPDDTKPDENGKVGTGCRDGVIAKTSVLRGSIIKSKLSKNPGSQIQMGRANFGTEASDKPSRDRVASEPGPHKSCRARPRRASDSALGGRDSPFLLSDDDSDEELDDTANGETDARNRSRKRFRKFSPSRGRLGSGGSSEGEEDIAKPDHVYRFKFKTVSETQDYPYMSARPSSLLRLVKLDKCDYPVGCRSAPFPFDTRPNPRSLDRGPFVRQYDIEPTSENVWSGVSLWAGEDSDNMSDCSNNSSTRSAPEKWANYSPAAVSSSTLRKIVSAGNSPVRNAEPEAAAAEPSPDLTGLDILSSVAFNADRLRNTPTKQRTSPRKLVPIKMQVRTYVRHIKVPDTSAGHIHFCSKRKSEEAEKERGKVRKVDT